MTRPVKVLITAGIVLLIALVYLASPASNSTRALRVVVDTETLSPQQTGYRAKIVNDSLLPVFVSRCETISDAMERNIRVGDALQRRPSGGVTWETIVERNGCEIVPTGVIKAKLSRKLLWPKQTLYTANFFPNVGVANSPFNHGDELRFLVFTASTQDSQALSSPGFKIQ